MIRLLFIALAFQAALSTASNDKASFGNQYAEIDTHKKEETTMMLIDSETPSQAASKGMDFAMHQVCFDEKGKDIEAANTNPLNKRGANHAFFSAQEKLPIVDNGDGGMHQRIDKRGNFEKLDCENKAFYDDVKSFHNDIDIPQESFQKTHKYSRKNTRWQEYDDDDDDGDFKGHGYNFIASRADDHSIEDIGDIDDSEEDLSSINEIEESTTFDVPIKERQSIMESQVMPVSDFKVNVKGIFPEQNVDCEDELFDDNLGKLPCPLVDFNVETVDEDSTSPTSHLQRISGPGVVTTESKGILKTPSPKEVFLQLSELDSIPPMIEFIVEDGDLNFPNVRRKLRFSDDTKVYDGGKVLDVNDSITALNIKHQKKKDKGDGKVEPIIMQKLNRRKSVGDSKVKNKKAHESRPKDKIMHEKKIKEKITDKKKIKEKTIPNPLKSSYKQQEEEEKRKKGEQQQINNQTNNPTDDDAIESKPTVILADHDGKRNGNLQAEKIAKSLVSKKDLTNEQVNVVAKEKLTLTQDLKKIIATEEHLKDYKDNNGSPSIDAEERIIDRGVEYKQNHRVADAHEWISSGVENRETKDTISLPTEPLSSASQLPVETIIIVSPPDLPNGPTGPSLGYKKIKEHFGAIVAYFTLGFILITSVGVVGMLSNLNIRRMTIQMASVYNNSDSKRPRRGSVQALPI